MFKNFLRGILIGSCMLVPGMSAGTLIILVGAYGLLIAHINGLFKSKKQFVDAIIFMLPVGLGACVGVFSLGNLLKYLVDHQSFPTFMLFAGFIAGAIPLMVIKIFEKSDTKPAVENLTESVESKPKLWHIIPMVIACAVVISLALFQPEETGVKDLSAKTAVMLVICGALASFDMILPGLSGSFILILLGYYNTLLDAITTFNMPILLLFMIGVPVGALIAAKVVGFFLKKHKRMSFAIVIGFLIGSVVSLFLLDDTFSSGTDAIGIASGAILVIVGFIISLLLSLTKTNVEI